MGSTINMDPLTFQFSLSHTRTHICTCVHTQKTSTYACTYANMHIYAYTNTCTCPHMWIYANKFTHRDTRAHTPAHTHTYTHACTDVHVSPCRHAAFPTEQTMSARNSPHWHTTALHFRPGYFYTGWSCLGPMGSSLDTSRAPRCPSPSQ